MCKILACRPTGISPLYPLMALEEPASVSMSTPCLDPEELHRQNVRAILQQEEQQAMGRLFHQQQLAAKSRADLLNRLGPKGNLQVVPPTEKGLQGRRSTRRTAILENIPSLGVSLVEDRRETIALSKVPIKLDIELDGYKLRDSLIWCMNDTSVSVDDFAAITCEDFELPANLYVPAIVKSINEQLSEYQDYLGMLKMMGGLREFCGIRGLIRVYIIVVIDDFYIVFSLILQLTDCRWRTSSSGT